MQFQIVDKSERGITNCSPQVITRKKYDATPISGGGGLRGEDAEVNQPID